MDLNHCGTLSDVEIKDICGKGKLIIENFEQNNIKQACYELRASNIYWDLSEIDKNKQRKELKNEEYILIKPRQLVAIITLEKLELPKDVLGRILTKGSLFSLGIVPVNTYADPGFYGKLGIVFNNLSNNYIKINVNDNIAKIEFSKLAYPVESDYRGQHGYETGIWPVKTENILSAEEIKNDCRIKDKIAELEITHGEFLASVIRNVFRYGRNLMLSTIAYLTFTLLLIGIMISVKTSSMKDIFNPIVSVALGVISNIIFGICTNVFTNTKSRKK